MIRNTLRLVIALLCLAPFAPAQHVRIHEFLASNDGGLLDEDGDDSDWIELWNAGSTPVNLNGWQLTDDLLDPDKWVFPSVTIPPGNYHVVFASDKDRRDPGGVLHTNFKLSSGGEYLALLDASGTVVTAFSPSFPPQEPNRSYGFLDTPSPAGFLVPPTPGEPNGSLFAGLEPVTASRARGVFNQSFQVELNSPDVGVQIFYTLDGSEPAPGSAIPYQGPIPITKTTCLRASAVAAGFVPAPTATYTYVFASSVRAQTNATATAAGFPAQWVEDDGTDWTLNGTRPGASYVVDDSMLAPLSDAKLVQMLRRIPTVSLVMPGDHWFGDGSSGVDGIYCNSLDEGDQWERPVSMEWIEPRNLGNWQISCGVGIQGGSSTNRMQRNQLSLALFFKEEFGPKKLERQLFGPGSAERFDYLVLDANNQNSINSGANPSTKAHAQELRDRFMMDMQAAMGSEEIHGRAVHLYLNGLYWGVYHLHERPDHRWDAEYRGGDDEEYDWIKVGQVQAGNQTGSSSSTPSIWNQAVEIALGGVAPGDTWNGQSAWHALAHRVNLERYADYLLLHYYAGNTDWPGKNWMMTSHARNSAELLDVHDEPDLRPHSWDAEAVLYWSGNELLVGDGFYDRTGVISETWPGSVVLFHTALRNHPEWPRIFGDRTYRHVFHPDGALYVEPGFDSAGTAFDPSHPERNRPAALYYERAEIMKSVALLEFARWGDYWYSPGTIEPANWIFERDRLLKTYFPVRSEVLIAQLRNAPVPLYPSIDAVQFSHKPGNLPAGTTLALDAPAGIDILYTTDGLDPRRFGGAIETFAQTYSQPIPIPSGEFTRILARTYSNGTWGPLADHTFRSGVDLALNEIQLANDSTIADSNGEFEDWIEIANRGDQTLDLSGFTLSDRDGLVDPWAFPAGTQLDPGGYLIVFCDEDGGQVGLHADFKLSATYGEELVLRAPPAAGAVVIDQVTVGGLQADLSWARWPDSLGAFRVTNTPSPGTTNPLSDKQPE